MVDTSLLLTLVETGAGVVAVAVAVFAWPHREKPAGFPVVTLALAAAGWAFAGVIGGLTDSLTPSLVLQSFTYVMTDVVALSWLFIAAEYAGRTWFQRRRVIAVLLGEIAVHVVIMATNPAHELFYLPGTTLDAQGFMLHEKGILFWLSVLWSYALILVGNGILVVEMRDRQGMYRVQAAAVLASGLIPSITALFEAMNLLSGPGFNLSTVGIAASGVILMWALFYADFLEVVPVARKTLMESMDDAVVALDTENRIIDINPLAEDLFDIDADALGEPVQTALSEYPDFVAHLASDQTSDAELTLADDGTTRYYDLQSSSIDVDGSRVTALSEGTQKRMGEVVVIRDITDQKTKQKELQQANQQLDQFASFVSHDLRNPLGIAQTYLDFARDSGRDDDFDAVEESLERMDDMIADLLTFARMGGTVSETSDVSVHTVTTEAWDGVETTDATLDAREATATVQANRSHLLNVFENLFRNAREHNTGEITVRVWTTDDGEGTTIRVEDDGTGIPSDHQGDIFDQGYTTNEDGSGLGLSLVEHIVTAHGWTLSVGEGTDGGAQFEIQTATDTRSSPPTEVQGAVE